MDALCEVSAIDTLLSNFIRPLQGAAIATVKRDPLTSEPLLDAQGVHCHISPCEMQSCVIEIALCPPYLRRAGWAHP